MTAGTLLSILLLILRGANSLFAYLQEKKLISEGEDRQIAKQLLEMSARSTTIRQVSEKWARMSDAQVFDEINKSGDFRD